MSCPPATYCAHRELAQVLWITLLCVSLSPSLLSLAFPAYSWVTHLLFYSPAKQENRLHFLLSWPLTPYFFSSAKQKMPPAWGTLAAWGKMTNNAPAHLSTMACITVLHCPALHRTALQNTALHGTTQHNLGATCVTVCAAPALIASLLLAPLCGMTLAPPPARYDPRGDPGCLQLFRR